MKKMAYFQRLIFALLLLSGIIILPYCTNNDVPKVDCDRWLQHNSFVMEQLLPIFEQDTIIFQIDKQENKTQETYVKTGIKMDTLHFINEQVETTEPCINQRTLHMVRTYVSYKNLDNTDSIHISTFNDGRTQKFVVELSNYTLYHGNSSCVLCAEQTSHITILNDTFASVHKLNDGLVNKKYITDSYQYFLNDGRLKIQTLPKDEALGYFDLDEGLLFFVLNNGEANQETWTRILN